MDNLSEGPSAYLDGHTNVAEINAHCDVAYITIVYPELPYDRNTCKLVEAIAQRTKVHEWLKQVHSHNLPTEIIRKIVPTVVVAHNFHNEQVLVIQDNEAKFQTIAKSCDKTKQAEQSIFSNDGDKRQRQNQKGGSRERKVGIQTSTVG